MTKKLKKWEFYGFLFVAALGTLGHFLYDISGQNMLVGKFFPVNESIWEHLKLLFFPYVIFSVAEWFCVGKGFKGFAFSKLIGVLSGMLFTVVFYYAYSGILGKNIDFVNILIFFLPEFFLCIYKYMCGFFLTCLRFCAMWYYFNFYILFSLLHFIYTSK